MRLNVKFWARSSSKMFAKIASIRHVKEKRIFILVSWFLISQLIWISTVHKKTYYISIFYIVLFTLETRFVQFIFFFQQDMRDHAGGPGGECSLI